MRGTVAYLLAGWLCLRATAFTGVGRHNLLGRGINSQSTTLQFLAPENAEDDIVAKRIVVKGDVQGGYYRSCVLNEVSTETLKGSEVKARRRLANFLALDNTIQAGRFRRLVGTMTPPDDSNKAEIYVEVG